MNTPAHTPLVVVVSHSHWDREWYQPFEIFRFRLIQLVEQLLDILETNPGYQHFMLDGQTVLLEDIVELRPDLEERLRHHIEKGRISIGPWYVLQDEFLIGSESLARNLLLGRQIAHRFGRPMNVGYIPDAFGHVSQIPRILQGFNMDSAVFWRGVGDQIQHNEFLWEAPAGAQVLSLWLRWNYSTAERLPNDVEAVHGKLQADLDRMVKESPARILLWMNGTDHQMPQAYLPSLLQKLREKNPEAEIIHGKLSDAVDTARERLNEEDLEVLQNELRRTGPGVGFILPGVFSARNWQQRDHDLAEWRLTRETEPFVTWAGLERRGPMEHVWKNLLKCQPHDSICGCSVDSVHREIAVRQEKVQQLATILFEESVRSLAEDPILTPGMIRNDPHPEAIALASAHPYPVQALVETEIERPADRMPFRLVGPHGEIPYAILENTAADPTLRADNPKKDWMRKLQLRLLARDVPPQGLQTIRLEPGEPTAQAEGLQIDGDSISNGLLSVAPASGGVAITDLETGTTIRHTFEDMADLGDEYNFTPLLSEAPHHPPNPTCHAELDACSVGLRAHFQWELPSELNPERNTRVLPLNLELKVHFRLQPNSRTVSCAIEVDNPAKDHRLRARFDLGDTPTSFLADSPFDWVRRPAGDPPPAPDAVELPMAQHPMMSMASIDLKEVRFGIGAIGLREVELNEEGQFFLTILRSVGWLSRGDLHNRPREAGPNLPSPDAQGLGIQRFQYALSFQQLSEKASAIHRQLEPTLHPPSPVEMTGVKLAEQAFLDVSPSSIRLAAIKRAEGDNRVLIRLIGPDLDDEDNVQIRIPGKIKEAHLSDLDERPGSPLQVASDGEESVVTLSLAARDIATVALRLGGS